MNSLSSLFQAPKYLIFLLFFYSSLNLAGQSKPVITDIGDQIRDEGEPFSAIHLDDLVSDDDNTDAELTWTFETGEDLSVVIEDHIAVVSPEDINWFGNETVTFIVQDPGFLSDTDVAVFEVLPVNDAPVVGDIPGQRIVEGELFTPLNLDLYVTDVDNAVTELAWAYSGGGDLNVTIDALHEATIEIPENWTGSENISFIAEDPEGLTGEDIAEFTVMAVPEAADDIYDVDEGSTLSTPAPGVLTNDTDADGDLLTAVLVAGPTYSPTFDLNEDGSFVYDHSGVESVTDDFTYKVSDGTYESDPATVIITINPINDAPEFAPIPPQEIDEGGSFDPVDLTLFVSDPDNTNNELTWTANPDDNLVAILDEATHAATVEPENAGWSGTGIVTFTVSDPGDEMASQDALFTITAVNEAPVAVDDDGFTTDEGAPLTVEAPGVLANDTDIDGDDLTALLVSGPAYDPAFDLNEDGSFVYNHSGAESENDAFTYKVTDGTAESGIATVFISINPVNDAPVFTNIPPQEVPEGGSFDPVDLTLYVTDPDNTNNELTWAANPDDNLVAMLDGTTHIATVTPDDIDWNGTGSVLFTVTDPDNESASKTASFTVTAVNDSPVAVGDAGFTIAEGTTLVVDNPGVLFNDTDADGDALLAELVLGPENDAAFNLFSDGSFSYTHNGTETESDAFTYRVNDGSAFSNHALVNIAVSPVNDAPQISGIPNQLKTEGHAFESIHLNNYISDAEDQDNQLSLAASGYSSSSITVNINNDSHIAHIIPASSWTGTETVRFTVTDQNLASAFDEAVFTMAPLAETPTNINITGTSVVENNGQITNIGTLSTEDPDLGDTFVYTFASGTGDDDNNLFDISGTTFRTNAVFDHEAKSSYTVRIRTTGVEDNLWFEKQFAITIIDVNEAPFDISLTNNSIPENSPINTQIGLLSASDPDEGNSFTYTLVSGAGSEDNGSFNIAGIQLRNSAIFDYETKPTYHIRLRVSDGALTFEEAFTISVTFANVAPTDIALSANTVAENMAAGTLVGNFSTTDPNAGDNHTYTLVSGAGSTDNASFSISGIQLLTGSTFNFETKSSYSIRIRSTDANTLFFEKVFIIAVSDVNEPPVAGNDAYVVGEGNPLLIGAPGILGNDTDPESGTLTAIKFSDPTHGTLNFAGDGSFTYTHDGTETTSDNFTYRAFDGTNQSNLATVTFTITAGNDAPVLAGIEGTSLTFNEGGSATAITGTITVSDIDNPTLASATVQITSGLVTTEDVLEYAAADGINGSYNSSNGTYTLTGSATVAQYQAALRRMKYQNTNTINPSTTTRTVSFTVNDGTSPSNTVARNINIVPSNTIPVIANVDPAVLPYCIGSSGEAVIAPALTVTDIDNTTMVSATVRISAGYAAAEDFLRFTLPTGISGVYNSGTGILTLSGSASIDDYQTALRSVKYENTNLTAPSTASRTVSFSIFDGVNTSDPVTRNINVSKGARALLGGSYEICNDGVSRANISIDFVSGTAPYTVTIRRRENPLNDTTLTNIMDDPFIFNARVIGDLPTSHQVFTISDASGCVGDPESGSAMVSYKPSPTAVITGTESTCPGEPAILKVTLNSTVPSPNWSFTYTRDGANPATVSGITGYSYDLQVTAIGTYALTSVQDNVCTGKVSGTGLVNSYEIPTAVISGSATICEHISTNLNVALTGNGDWRFSYRLNGGTPVEVLNVTASPNSVPVQQAGTYTLYEVYDRNCKGIVSGSATINVTPAPVVSFSGLAPAYNKLSTVWVPLTGNPSGGTFTGPGIIPYNALWYFVPSLPPIGTHNIVYSYRPSPASCYGYDTAVVRVLEADAVIEFENDRINYCENDQPFLITGVNLPDVIGTFTIEGGVGLTDHHNNTATINPSLLDINQYTVTYSYVDGTVLSVTRDFNIGKMPEADFNWATECYQEGQSVFLKNTSVSTFGNITDTSFLWKINTSTGFDQYTTRNVTHVFPQAGNHTIVLEMENSYGCKSNITKTFPLRPTRALSGETYFEDFETHPISWQKGKPEELPVNSWRLGDPTKGFNGAYSGDYCWYTSIPGSTAPLEQSWITSPCFDFTDMERPMLKAHIWRMFTDIRDGATLQATADSGKSWILIGKLNDGVNWFNEYTINAEPGDQSIGWSNKKDAGWLEARHSLDILKGKTKVQFRIAYGSTGTAIGNDGFAFDNFWIGERNRISLIEHFTNSSDEETPHADSILNDFISGNELNVVDLQYHTSNPSNDPFYEHNPVIPNAREFYYGIPGVPYSVLNGGSNPLNRFDYDNKPFNPNTPLVESLADSKFSIQSISEINNNVLTTQVQVFPYSAVPLTELSVHIAVVERLITGVTGQNGETVFKNVVKTMLPGAAGTTIYKAWDPHESVYIDGAWTLQHVYDRDELRLVAFIQNESTKEVYQAVIDTISLATGIDNPFPGFVAEKSFILYPNPAQQLTYIKFNRETEKEVVIELYNNLGVLVYKRREPAGISVTEIPLEDFPNGLYLLRLSNSDVLLGTSKLTISK